MAAGGVRLRGEDARVEAVPRLVVDPVLVPRLLAVFAFQRVQSLRREELNDAADGGVLQVFCSRCGRRRCVKRQGVQSIDGDGSRWARERRRRQSSIRPRLLPRRKLCRRCRPGGSHLALQGGEGSDSRTPDRISPSAAIRELSTALGDCGVWRGGTIGRGAPWCCCEILADARSR